MSRGERTRTAILDEAFGQASRLGLEGLSIGTLARSVGMSKSGLFAHFGSKAELQTAVLERGAERFIARVVLPAIALPRGEPRVRALVDNWLRWSAGPRGAPSGCLFVSAASEFDDRPGPVRDEVARQVRDWRGTLARAARIAIEEGHFRADLDPEQFAFELHALLLGYQLQARLLERDAQRLAEAALDRLFVSARPS